MCKHPFILFPRWLITGFLLFFLAGNATAVELRGREVVPRYRPGMSVTLEVLVNGRALPTIAHEGKVYLPISRVGEEYEIRVSNHGPRRIVAVVSVDGLSVITGKPASETGTGYIVAPRSHVLIKGWRRSLDRVAAFRFVDRQGSYAWLKGRPANIGVIGMVAFEEWVPRPRLELEKAKGDARSPATRLHPETGGIGTAYGRDIDSRAVYVPFIRSPNKQTVTLYYDIEEALRRAGVPIPRQFPSPFPADDEFAQPPPGHKGR
jgi:hypothetical protein